MRELRHLFPDIPLSRPLIIAGPCSAETEEQTLSTATELRNHGIRIFRAGLWKPRTHPGGFEGVGEAGLPWLRKVSDTTGMLTATEVATPRHVRLAVDAGIDILWIGARTSANPFAVQEIADAIAATGRDICVLVKNPVNPDLELWIGALQRLRNAGVERLGAVHRGFSAYGQHVYRNPPQWRIPIELHRRYPQLPIICDPSHIGGRRELIAPLCQQALDMSFDGLIIESHCSPQEALSDKQQQLTPAELATIAASLVLREKTDPSESLAVLREKIDRIDDELLELLGKRMRVAREIGEYKKRNSMPVIQSERYNDLMQRRVEAAGETGLSDDFIRTLLAAIHEESVRQQIEIVNSR